MLQSVDVLIGLTVVMLALSMVVTVVTQALTTAVNSRGYHLRRGLVDLLQQLDPSLDKDVSKRIATAVLTHPLVSGSQIPLLGAFIGRQRLGNVVHRDELTALLMRFAAGDASNLDSTVESTLKKVLTSNGIADPSATLARVRELTMQLERTSPDASTAQRHTTALLHAASSEFVAKINAWFDQTMDRTAQRFTASTRAVTFVGALVVAFGLQVDTPALVNRLAADDALRAALVNEAQRMLDEGDARDTATATDAASESPDAGATTGAEAPKDTTPAQDAEPQTPDAPAPSPNAASQAPAAAAAAGTPSQTPGQAAEAADSQAKGGASAAEAARQTDGNAAPKDQGTTAGSGANRDAGRRTRDLLASAGIIRLPTSREAWTANITGTALLGMLITAFLLSLGAPFWYNALGRLLRLRSLLATKDDVQRGERQQTAPSAGTPGAGSQASAAAGSSTLVGERGDLTALG